jgi:hypothetical protein
VQFQLKTSTNFKIKITDILGRLFYNEEVKSKELIFDRLINISDFKTNELIVIIDDGLSQVSKKIIITQ